MTSGAINAQLMIGIIDCARNEFIHVLALFESLRFVRLSYRLPWKSCTNRRRGCRNARANCFDARFRTIQKDARINTHEEHQDKQRQQQPNLTTCSDPQALRSQDS